MVLPFEADGVTSGVRFGLRLSHSRTPGSFSVLPPGTTHAWAHAPDRRYVQDMADRRAYPSDLSDARWELIEPVLSAWRFERRGRALDFGRPPRA